MKVGGAYVARLCKPFESNYRKYVSTFVLVKYLSEWSEEMSRSVKKTQRKIVNLGITYLLLIRSGINQKHLRSTFPTISIPPLEKIIPGRNAETFSIDRVALHRQGVVAMLYATTSIFEPITVTVAPYRLYRTFEIFSFEMKKILRR